MNVNEKFDLLYYKAINDKELKNSLLKTNKEENSLKKVCEIARENGIELYPIDIINEGEEFYAAMRRSTNGGGENSPKLEYEDDIYELFIARLRNE